MGAPATASMRLGSPVVDITQANQLVKSRAAGWKQEVAMASKWCKVETATAIILENMTVCVHIIPEILHTAFQPDALAPGKSSSGDSVRELVT